MSQEAKTKVDYQIKETRHGNYDFYIYLDGKPIASSIDSYAKREDCIKTALALMLCVDCSQSLIDWKQAEAEHIKDYL